MYSQITIEVLVAIPAVERMRFFDNLEKSFSVTTIEIVAKSNVFFFLKNHKSLSHDYNSREIVTCSVSAI